MKKVLIVDDSDEIRHTINFLLRIKGFLVFEARDGEECIKILENEGKFDLIILDLKMPKMDGKRALTKIRDELHMATVPVIIYSAYADDKDREFFEKYATHVVEKPINAEDLINVIDMYTI